MTSSSGCSAEAFGNKVESIIGGRFYRVGTTVGTHPKKTICFCICLTLLMGVGFAFWETENRGDKLWVPQGTLAETETETYQSYFDSGARYNSMIIQASEEGTNILQKELLLDALRMHKEVETRPSIADDNNEAYTFLDLCVYAGGTCANGWDGICSCLVDSIFHQWDYDMDKLQEDADILATINQFGSRETLEATFGNPIFDETTGHLVSANAFTISYFLEDRSEVVGGTEIDPINSAWEKNVFLDVAQSVSSTHPSLYVDYLAARSFDDEFEGELNGDLLLVQVSYVIAFLFLGANLGNIRCGTGSRWTMAIAGIAVVALSTAAGFGLSSLCGLFYGPVHSILPFILLGIGVDDAFVIVNAFNRERKGPRTSESNEDLAKRCARSLARAGASITVTSLTDLVAFGISSSSRLPALASFCSYAAIAIFFLWFFASTFFSATMVLDERRQRDNRRECLCCITRRSSSSSSDHPIIEEENDSAFEEGFLSRYFRYYHAPAVLSKIGKIIVFMTATGLFAFGLWGSFHLTVEDSERSFIPKGSYLNGYLNSADEYYPSTGISVNIVFEGGADIYASRDNLSNLNKRLSGYSDCSPYIAEPNTDSSYRNVMTGLHTYLRTYGSAAIGNVPLGEDHWPTNEEDFITTLSRYAWYVGPGAEYVQDVSFLDDDRSKLEAIRVQLEYVRLTKLNGGEIIDDADRQIEAMDGTRELISTWTDLPPAFPYSAKFITIEGFKIIKKELFMNVGLAIAAVGVIVFFTVASPMTSFLITLNVACCIFEILGFMHVLGIVIDSVSVINMVLAVGLSVDYSAHVGHCFMVKGGNDKNKRAAEALADIGAAVLNGALSTFLAVAVLLFSSSYVFVVLSRQFALTVALGITHGLIFLPVMLSVFGPKAFESAENLEKDPEKSNTATSHLPGRGSTFESRDSSEDKDNENKQMMDIRKQMAHVRKTLESGEKTETDTEKSVGFMSDSQDGGSSEGRDSVDKEDKSIEDAENKGEKRMDVNKKDNLYYYRTNDGGIICRIKLEP